MTEITLRRLYALRLAFLILPRGFGTYVHFRGSGHVFGLGTGGENAAQSGCTPLPLYVPPAALTAEEVDQHARLSARALEAQQRGDFEEANRITDRTWKIGTFRTQFLHDPEGPIMDIFPTLPADVGKSISIGRIVQTHLRSAQPA
jgi:hypothetical protein